MGINTDQKAANVSTLTPRLPRLNNTMHLFAGIFASRRVLRDRLWWPFGGHSLIFSLTAALNDFFPIDREIRRDRTELLGRDV